MSKRANSCREVAAQCSGDQAPTELELPSLETEPDRLCKMSPQAKQFPVLAPPGHNVHCKDQPNESPYHNRP